MKILIYKLKLYTCIKSLVDYQNYCKTILTKVCSLFVFVGPYLPRNIHGLSTEEGQIITV